VYSRFWYQSGNQVYFCIINIWLNYNCWKYVSCIAISYGISSQLLMLAYFGKNWFSHLLVKTGYYYIDIWQWWIYFIIHVLVLVLKGKLHNKTRTFWFVVTFKLTKQTCWSLLNIRFTLYITLKPKRCLLDNDLGSLKELHWGLVM